jgi:hypothetical protein
MRHLDDRIRVSRGIPHHIEEGGEGKARTVTKEKRSVSSRVSFNVGGSKFLCFGMYSEGCLDAEDEGVGAGISSDTGRLSESVEGTGMLRLSDEFELAGIIISGFLPATLGLFAKTPGRIRQR